ncbi:MAG TPA: ATP-binding protein [Gemmatimonadaceae bacterium]
MALLSLLLVQARIEQRTRALFDNLSSVADPARSSATDLELGLALEVAGTRGFLLTGDPGFATSYGVARARRRLAEERLLQLTRRISQSVVDSTIRLTQRLHEADIVLDSLYGEQLSKSAYLARLDRQQAHFTDAVTGAAKLDNALERAAAVQRGEIRHMQSVGTVVSYFLVLIALASGILFIRLALGFKSIALRLDARERQQSALVDVSRRLNAPIDDADAARIVARGALDATSALGAVVEMVSGDPARSKTYVATAARGDEPRLESADNRQSLTALLHDPAKSFADVEASTLAERAAIHPSGNGRELQGIVVPLIPEDHTRGALAILRPRTDVHTAQAETSYLRALTELAMSAWHRIELSDALVASEERFRQVADNIRAFVWLRDPVSLRFLYANAAYETIWGRPPENLYRDPTSWLDDVHPDDHERVVTTLQRSHDAAYEMEYRVRRPDGAIRWVWARGFPVRDERGAIYRTAGITEDITEQKQSEVVRQRLLADEQAARRASEAAHAAAERRREELEKVTESRARLMRGFTHDVKNPLGAADGFLALLEADVFGPLAAPQSDSVARARKGIRQALDLIGRALNLARAESVQLDVRSEQVDLRDIVADAVEEYHAQAEAKQIAMAAQLPRDPLMVVSDPLRVRQIIGNLISNAIKYTESDGRVDVIASAQSDGDAPAPGDWVVVTVADTGRGIAPENLPKVFDEFARFDPETTGGSGVGLAISQHIARALGGAITVQSTLGAGSRFSLWLPNRHGSDDVVQSFSPTPRARTATPPSVPGEGSDAKEGT